VDLTPTFDRYLHLLGVERARPTFESLTRLVDAQLRRVPFENVSKVHALHVEGRRDIPSLDRHLDGIEHRGLGGTCYANNHYLCSLLEHLGFDASLCGADMPSGPDVHAVVFVRVEGRELLVDAGYAAPFYEPLPRDLPEDVVVAFGRDRYVLRPQDAAGRSRLDHYRDGERLYGYLAKPTPRTIEHFAPAIRHSYRPAATFLNALLVVRFHAAHTITISNQGRIVSTADGGTRTRLESRRAVVEAVVDCLGAAPEVVEEALAGLGELQDVYPEHERWEAP